MSERATSPDGLDRALKRLAGAIDLCERAADLRMRHDDERSDAEDEFALMQDDRSRLAVELDAALDRSRALERASAEASDRLARAAETIGLVVGRFEPPAS